MNPVPKQFSVDTRQANLSTINGQEFDICIVGGGITGAAIARDAAIRGFKTILLEKNDFASGTSSRSSKLIHGGVRYLEHFEFGLVMESTRERARLWKLAPKLVSPLPFLFPAYKNSRQPLWKLSMGLTMYDMLAMFRAPSNHKTMNKQKTMNAEPILNSQDLTGSVFYWDGATDDASLTMSNIVDAQSNGAQSFSRTTVTGIDWDERKANTVYFRDELSGQIHEIKAHSIVSAVGPWSDKFLGNMQIPFRKILSTTRGSHIVVPHHKLPCKHATVIFHPKDERVLFSIPWEDVTIIGTTDIFDEDSPDRCVITHEEVLYLLEAANSYFPSVKIDCEDIISTWAGLRPLVLEEGKDESAISRDHFLHWDKRGLCIITGGKLTTHREMAEQAVDLISKKNSHQSHVTKTQVKRCSTHKRPYPDVLIYNKNKEPLGGSTASCLDNEDIRKICTEQMVLSIEDLLVRRSQIFYREYDNGFKVLDLYKKTICETLHWDETKWQQELKNYKTYVKTNRWDPTKVSPPCSQDSESTTQL